MGKFNSTNLDEQLRETLESLPKEMTGMKNVIGELSVLETENRTTLVEAINEVKQLGNSVKKSMVSALLSIDNNLPITPQSRWDDIESSLGNIQTGLELNGIVESYKIARGENISAGDFVMFINQQTRTTTPGTGDGTIITMGKMTNFSTGSPEYVTSILLSNTEVLIVYRNYSNNGYGTAVILTMIEGTITVGQPVIFNASTTYYIHAIFIAEGKVLISFQQSNGSYGTSIVLSISNKIITIGTPTTWAAERILGLYSTLLADGNVLICYRGSTGLGKCVVLTIYDTDIITGRQLTFNNIDTDDIHATLLPNKKVLITYRNNNNNSAGYGVVVTPTRTEITIGTPIMFSPVNTQHIAPILLTDGKVLVAYRSNETKAYGMAVIISIVDTTIGVGAPITFASFDTQYISSVVLNNNKILLSYRNASSTSGGFSVVLSVDDMNITSGTPIVFSTAAISYTSAISLYDGSVLLNYRNTTNSKGESVILTIDGDIIELDTEIVAISTTKNIQGVAKSSGIENQQIEVLVPM